MIRRLLLLPVIIFVLVLSAVGWGTVRPGPRGAVITTGVADPTLMDPTRVLHLSLRPRDTSFTTPSPTGRLLAHSRLGIGDTVGLALTDLSGRGYWTREFTSTAISRNRPITAAVGFSPDETALYHTFTVNMNNGALLTRTAVLSADGETLLNWPQPRGTVRARSFAWSPNSRYLAEAYSIARANGGQRVGVTIGDMQAETVEMFALEASIRWQNGRAAIWSADSKWMLLPVSQGESNLSSAHLLTPDGEIHDDILTASYPTWSQQGAKLAYLSSNSVNIYDANRGELVEQTYFENEVQRRLYSWFPSDDGLLLADFPAGGARLLRSLAGEMAVVAAVDDTTALEVEWKPTEGAALITTIQGSTALPDVFLLSDTGLARLPNTFGAAYRWRTAFWVDGENWVVLRTSIETGGQGGAFMMRPDGTGLRRIAEDQLWGELDWITLR